LLSEDLGRAIMTENWLPVTGLGFSVGLTTGGGLRLEAGLGSIMSPYELSDGINFIAFICK
jgi:hypothetical protein